MSYPATKSEVLASLSSLNPPLGQLVERFRPIGEAETQPKAFSVVARQLPALTAAYCSIEEHLQSTEADQISDKYPAIQRAAVACHGQIQCLERLFQAVNNNRNKADAYRQAVESERGRTLEMVMADMLRDAKSAAVTPLVGIEHLKALRDALDQVERLPSSLGNQSQAPQLTFNNHGTGNQFHHGGDGNMYSCSGGQQINGQNDNGTYNNGPTGKQGN